MKSILIITLFAGAAMVFSTPTPGSAQNIEQATHLWLYSNTSTVYVPVATKEGCKIMVTQAALLNSSTGHCYFKEQFLQEIKCNKSTQVGGIPNCTMNSKSTR